MASSNDKILIEGNKAAAFENALRRRTNGGDLVSDHPFEQSGRYAEEFLRETQVNPDGTRRSPSRTQAETS